MDSQKTNELYERFSHLYRERLAPLESSKMAWGFQCGNGWYNLIHKMSKRITNLLSDDESAPAIVEVSRNEDGTLYVDVRNPTLAIADIVETAKEQSRIICETCGYSLRSCVIRMVLKRVILPVDGALGIMPVELTAKRQSARDALVEPLI